MRKYNITENNMPIFGMRFLEKNMAAKNNKHAIF